MKKFTTILALSAILLFAGMIAASDETSKDEAASKTTTEAVAEKPVELTNQTLCPVMGGKIDSTVYTDIQGQRVYHCCPGCSKPLKTDPDKFFEKAAKDNVLFENTQTNCPVSGEKLEKKEAFTDYAGRRIYFCCEGCEGPFVKDAQKYLSAMDSKVDEKEEKKEQSAHEEHNQ